MKINFDIFSEVGEGGCKIKNDVLESLEWTVGDFHPGNERTPPNPNARENYWEVSVPCGCKGLTDKYIGEQKPFNNYHSYVLIRELCFFS